MFISSNIQDNNRFMGPIPTNFGFLRKLEYLTFCKYIAIHHTVCLFSSAIDITIICQCDVT